MNHSALQIMQRVNNRSQPYTDDINEVKWSQLLVLVFYLSLNKIQREREREKKINGFYSLKKKNGSRRIERIKRTMVNWWTAYSTIYNTTINNIKHERETHILMTNQKKSAKSYFSLNWNSWCTSLMMMINTNGCRWEMNAQKFNLKWFPNDC